MNPKREKFCECFIVCKSGKEAAIQAGYSAKTARQQASQLLKEQEVQNYLKELGANESEILQLTRIAILEQTKEIAFNPKNKPSDRLNALNKLMDSLFPKIDEKQKHEATIIKIGNQEYEL